MILVCDTNVLSEIMKPMPDPAVAAWLGTQRLETLHTTTITRMEILFGIRRLPAGRRRDALEAAAGALFAEEFGDRLLGFDADAADHCAAIRAARASAGAPIGIEDAMIAAIARSRSAAIVTRDTGGFANCGIEIFDPWSAG